MNYLCSYVDDSISEASALANQLAKDYPAIEIQAVMPARDISATERIVAAARPNAVMVDYYLEGRSNDESKELAFRFLSRGVPAVFVTKDRDSADRLEIHWRGRVIPIYYKMRLLNDSSYKRTLMENLGVTSVEPIGVDYRNRLYLLQEKKLLKSMTGQEKDELKVLLARLTLEESEDARRIEMAQKPYKEEFDSLVESIRHLTGALNSELKSKHAISKKPKRT